MITILLVLVAMAGTLSGFAAGYCCARTAHTLKSIVDEEAPRCTCGFEASIGGRNPECPKHGDGRS